MLHFAEYLSPVGKLLLCSNGAALTGLWIGQEPECHCEEDEILTGAKLWLDDYFRGNVPTRRIPLAPEGTAFQKRVWDILQTIPSGETRTYGSIARQLGNKMSAQAVGQAVGRNPISILIPCQRVVGSGGKLTGYAWGIEKKKWLLSHEEKNMV